MADNIISFTKPTIAVITVVVLILGAFAFWYDRGESTALASNNLSNSVKSNTQRNDLQDEKITEVEKSVKANKDDLVIEKLARAEMIGVVNSTATDVREIRRTQESLTIFLMQYDYEKKKDK